MISFGTAWIFRFDSSLPLGTGAAKLHYSVGDVPNMCRAQVLGRDVGETMIRDSPL